MLSEELEALEKLLSFAFVMSENMVGLTKGNYNEATFVKKTYEYLHKYNVDLNSKIDLKEALRRLEAIDNAPKINRDIIDNYMSFKNDNTKPSDALECLDRIEAITKVYNIDLFSEFAEDLDTIKQSLIKAQEQETVLEIIKFTELKKEYEGQ